MFTDAMNAEASTNPDQLLAAAQAGAQDGLNRLLQVYGNYLKLLATTQMDRKLAARVSPSDIVQETMMEAHRDFPQFRGTCERQFLAWLRKILVHNLARNVERHVLAERRDVRREVSLDAMGEALDRSAARLRDVLANEWTSPSSNVHRRECSVILADQMAELPADYQTVLALRHIEGLAFADVAERMERSEGAVRMLWLRALDRLRELLQHRGVL